MYEVKPGEDIKVGDAICWYTDPHTGERMVMKADVAHQANATAMEDLNKGADLIMDMRTGHVWNADSEG